MREKLFKILILSSIYFFVNSLNLSASNAFWTDEFTTFSSRWDWDYNRGTGYKQLTTVDGVSIVEIGITEQSSSSGHSDCSLHEKRHQHAYGIFEARLRCVKGRGFNQLWKGTSGWGFWHWDHDPLKLSAAWFWWASTENNASLWDFQVMVARDSTVVFQKSLPEIDMQQWHIYRVELLPMGTRFLVDGNEVGFTRKRPNRLQKIEMWIDNSRVQVVDTKVKASGYLDVQQNQRMYIDWVRYYHGNSDQHR